MRGQGHRLTKEQVAEAVREYQSGTTTTTLAKRFGVTTTAVSRWLKRKKVKARVGAPPRKAPYTDLCADYISGLNIEQVAKKNHVSIGTVSRALKQNGVPARPAPSGAAHPLWKGGRTHDADQYVIVEGEREHRLLMQDLLQRKLQHWETVHHIDGNKPNNAHNNLAVMPKREHERFHCMLRAHSLPLTREVFERLCRLETPYCYRFTVEDARNSGLGKGKYLKPPRRPCRIKGCSRLRYGQGLCSMHWQRKHAKNKGYWISGQGKRTVFREKFTRTKNRLSASET
jgi:transposase